jgi:transcription termination/antitermination protein NusG
MLDDSLLGAAHVLKWFVLFVRSNQEKRVAQRLADREIEHFLPCWESVRQWKNRRVTLQIPLFPGYVFVRLQLSQRSKVLTIPNIVGLVGSKDSPAVISDDEVRWIKSGMEHGNAMPYPYLVAGQRVRIIAGALSGMQGILLRRQHNTRVVVSLDSIARSFVVEVELSAIELDRRPGKENARTENPRPDHRQANL